MKLGRTVCVAVFLIGANASAEARTLCNVPYQTIPGLEASLRVASRIWNGKDILTIVSKRTLWWFAERGHPAYPAVVCVRQITLNNGSHTRLPVQTDCNGAPERACAILTRTMSKAKW